MLCQKTALGKWHSLTIWGKRNWIHVSFSKQKNISMKFSHSRKFARPTFLYSGERVCISAFFEQLFSSNLQPPWLPRLQITFKYVSCFSHGVRKQQPIEARKQCYTKCKGRATYIIACMYCKRGAGYGLTEQCLFHHFIQSLYPVNISEVDCRIMKRYRAEEALVPIIHKCQGSLTKDPSIKKLRRQQYTPLPSK